MFFYPEDKSGEVINPEEVKTQFNHLVLHNTIPSNLLKVLANLNQRTSAYILSSINKYLTKETSGESSFILSNSLLVKEAGVSVIGETVLSPDIRLALNEPLIVTLKNAKESLVIDGKCLPEQLVNDINTDLFNHKHTGALREVLFIPIYHPGEKDPVFWAGLANSTQTVDAAKKDEAIVSECFRYCLAVVKNTLKYEEMRDYHRRLKLIITTIWDCAKHIGEIDKLTETLKGKACELFDCEACSIYLKEERNLVSRTTEYGAPYDFKNRGLYNIVIPVGLGYTGNVATTAELQNATKYTKSGPVDYCDNLDKYSGQETNNVLAFPMPFKEEQVFGVVELANKINKRHFTRMDEMYAAFFGRLCGALIYHSLNLRKSSANYENKEIVNAFLLRHMTVKAEEIHDVFRLVDIPDIEIYKMPNCLPSSTNEENTILVILNIFSELNFVNQFGIPVTKFLRFILNVKKSHEPLPYFNWFHTFTCFQFCYALVAGHELIAKEYLLPIEVFSMLLAALCHHMDYRGTVSCFQMCPGSVLESLYSSPGQISRHQAVGQTFRLLNEPKCTILENVSEEQYKQILLLTDKMIIATDMADHVNRFENYDQMIHRGYSFEKEEDRELLYQLIMGCIEMNDYARPWKHLREIGPRIFNEFLRQNEEPHAEGVFNFPDLNHRTKMAEAQSLFLSSTVLPSFEKLTKIIPSATTYLVMIKQNMDAWNTIRHKLKKEKSDNFIDLLLTDVEVEEAAAKSQSSKNSEEDLSEEDI